MHAGSIQVRLLGILAIGVVCSLIACSGGGAGPATVTAPGTSAPVVLELRPGAPDVSAGDSIPVTAAVSGVSDTSVTWSVDGIPGGNATVGTISGSGNTVTYTAPDLEGTHTIIIVSRADPTKSTTATVRIRPPKLAVTVSLSPGMATVAAGASQPFTATVENTTETGVTWTLDGTPTGNSTVGTISGTGTTITYTAPAAAGSHVLVATSTADPTKSASSTLTVFVPASVTSVAVSPASLNLSTGAQSTFTATVTGTGSFNPGVSWSAQRGSISSSGLYTAPATGGSDVVTATSVQTPTRTASATITVAVPNTITSVTVSPGTLSLNTTTQRSFTANVTGTGAYNPAVSWSAQRGTITSAGLYTAPSTAGSDVVTATSVQDTTRSAMASLTVTVPSTITAVAVSPSVLAPSTGSQTQFTATVTGTGTYSATVTWSTQRGTITSAGLYTAPATGGSDTVTATSTQDATKAATASLTVTVPNTITAVTVSPSTLSLSTSTQRQFTVTVTGTGAYSSNVTWAAQRGTITSTGLYTAPATAGSDTVTATSTQDTTKAATATLTVAAPNTITSVAVSPSSLTLNTSAQATFTATVAGTGTFNSAVTWTAQRGAITSAGVYSAPATGGSDVVTATSVQDTSKTATASLTVTIPVTITSVAVSPSILSLNTGTQAIFTAAVAGTGTFTNAVTWAAQRGTITSAGVYTAPATGGSDVVTARSVQDTSKTATANLTVTIPVTITSVTVSPSTLGLNTSTQTTFTATVTGTGAFNNAVTWAAQRGTITSAGVYTAPTTGGSDVVTARSVQDTTKTGTASLTVAVPSTITAVTVSPSILSLNTGTQNTFTPTVTGTGSYSAAVSWTAQRGTISSAGVYTAPATAGSDVVTATSTQDPSRSATASVTVVVPPAVSSVALSPASLTLGVSAQTQFTATVSGTGAYLSGVTWTAQQGTVSSSGLYTAPAAGGTDMVTATSVFDPTKSSFAIITVQAPVAVALTPSGTVQTTTAGSISLTSTVTGTTNTATNWTVDGIANGSAAVGTLTVSGNTATYRAPATAGTHAVKAVSAADPTKSSTVSLIVNPGVDPGPLAAFPGCEGMGCGATGGRGGVVYTVNTLSDTTNPGAVPWNGPNGPTCSLRDAMLKSGPRTIVFSVGGTIILHSAIYPVPPNLTIAGQTAPGGGIQISGDGTFGEGGSMIWIGANTILQYLRIRPGNAPLNTSNQGLTGLSMSMPTPNDVVIDHCSFEWDSNKAVGYWSDTGLQRNTFSWNLEAEGLANHSTGPLVGGYNMGQANLDQSSWDGHHNVLATLDHRLPQTNLKYGRWINNLVFGYNYAVLVRGGTQFDLIGNVWEGTASGLKSTPAKAEVRWADTVAHNENNIVPGGTAQLFMSNNFGPSNPTGSLDNFTTMLRTAGSENSQLDNLVVSSTYKADAPTIPPALNRWPITITPLASKADLTALLTPTVGAYRRLASDGSWVPNRDAVDARVIAYILNPATSPTALVPTAGPYPTLSVGTPIVSSVRDGISDEWKLAHGLSISDPSVANTILPNAHGFTILDLYLSGLFPIGTPLP